jgi:two-component system cell cycle sensor histidine kinase/response regulator CckA
VERGQGEPPTVLVVDDEPQVRTITARALAEGGFATLEATSAVEALALLQDPRAPAVQLLVTDIVMPDMSGDDLGRLLRETHPMLPVLYMSGYARPPLDFLSSSELKHCWITKPFTLTDIVQKARACLEVGRSLRH